MKTVSLIRSGSVVVKVYRVARPATATRAARTIYTVSWTEAGRLTRKQYADEDDARKFARTVADRLAAGRIGTAAVTAGDMDTLAAARAITGKVPLMAAIEEWAECRRLVGADALAACRAWATKHAGALPECTVAVAAKRYFADRQKNRVETKEGAGRTIPRFVEALGERQIAAIGPEQISRWLDQFEHPVSRNSHRKRVVTFFRWCRDWARPKLLPQDIRTAPEQVARVKEPDRQIGIIASHELRAAFALIQEKAPEYLPVLALGAYCGLRRAELHGQDWKDVLVEREFVRVTKAKPNTPARRLVPLPPAAIPWLIAARKASGPLCSNLALDRIRDICRTAGLDLADNGLRHSYISARVMVTGDKPRVALEAGTSIETINKHYLELMLPEEAAAWFEPIAAENQPAASLAKAE